MFGKTCEKQFLSIERLDNFSLKLLFWVQITKKDLKMLLR